MNNVICVLQQCQKAYEGVMDELALHLFKRATAWLILNKSEQEALQVVASQLTEPCILFLENYSEELKELPDEQAKYEFVIQSIFLL